MGDNSKIEWTDSTWNATVGCTKVSEGCDACYAERLVNGRMRHRYPGGFGKLVLHPDRLDQPLRWRRPRRIFVNSLSDLFHDQVPDGFIAAIWYVMGQCGGCIPEQYRGHIFQILTKRPGRMAAWLRRWADVGDPQIPPMDPAALRCGRAELIAEAAEVFGAPIAYDWMDGPRYWPTALPGLWLGTSVENQRWADIRIPKLLECPAAVRVVSAEPLLGQVALTTWLHDSDCAIRAESVCTCAEPREAHVDWVIAGGESGPGARPMHPAWPRYLRDQCQAAGVAFFFKQFGEWAPYPDDGPAAWADHPKQWCFVTPDGIVTPGPAFGIASQAMRRVGKKAAGRLLDGQEWSQFPDDQHARVGEAS